jgi:hypothetical protein
MWRRSEPWLLEVFGLALVLPHSPSLVEILDGGGEPSCAKGGLARPPFATAAGSWPHNQTEGISSVAKAAVSFFMTAQRRGVFQVTLLRRLDL